MFFEFDVLRAQQKSPSWNLRGGRMRCRRMRQETDDRRLSCVVNLGSTLYEVLVRVRASSLSLRKEQLCNGERTDQGCL